MASPLAQVDTNKMATTSSSPQSKDKLRQWTFPRSNNNSISSSTTTTTTSPLSHQLDRPAPSSTNSSDSEHGRSSSISPTYAHATSPSNSNKHNTKSKSSTTSKDLRHRSNASVFNPPPPAPPSSSPSAPLLSPSAAPSTPLPTKPNDLLRLLYSNLRRRSAQDILYLIIFGGCLVIFTSALLGQGYSAAVEGGLVSGVGAGAAGGEKVPSLAEQQAQAQVIDVKIPEVFMRKIVKPLAEPAPADVHQPNGDDSHDQGEDLLVDSPEDPALDDEHAHDHLPSPQDALFDDSHPSHNHESSSDPQHVDISPSSLEDDDDEPDIELEDTTHIAEEDVEAEDKAEEDENDDIAIEEDDDEDLRMHQAEAAQEAAEAEAAEAEEEEEEDDLTIIDDDEEDDTESLGELLDVEDVPEGEGDASLIPADDPLPLDLEDSDDPSADPDALAGDALRRPGGREGLEAMKREREALGRAREKWEDDVRDGRGANGGGLRNGGRRGRAVRIR
ncbi:hypothetical protein BCR35DRAFT_352088 [Leucosporidium creatinivorum]|uniref:Uncharacterized protein n=1 Tax=Leucosporidium creatinivorum TaxID=106004 RepID=A0A1Y2FG72_9BASI|nr:hypothetical protein BCR35DRAFT_352088 [Leucosporidium creatinivorum]